tara:strand:- start:338 stop:604 length:267 start_codon:yes stop_codon:yes gene_type:complete
MSGISDMTSREELWMERLTTSNLREVLFTADEAIATLKTIPLKSGKLPRDIPNKFKIQYIMRKSNMFVLVETRGPTDKKLNLWRVKNA